MFEILMLSMRSAIENKLQQITECICHGIQMQGKNSCLPGLYNGGFGVLLFLFHYTKCIGKNQSNCITELYCDQLIEELETGINTHTFCSGLSGILYLFEYLREAELVDIDISEEQDILEEYLVNKMMTDIDSQNYDFMHGALGVGLYFLRKKEKSLVISELINFLYNTAEKGAHNQIYRWESTLDIKTGQKGYNISLSHGISSIILFLSRVIKWGIEDSKTYEMLNGAVNYILSQEIDEKIYKVSFPSYSKDITPFQSRLAWCYGDLGIALSLYYAGKIIQNKEWENKGLSVLLKSTQRRSRIENGISDAGICHGTSGIALIYRRMYLETGMREFKDATEYWIYETLKMAYHKDSQTGYKTYEYEGVGEDYSLLTGVSGIGLVLSSYLTNDDQSWDEILLLS